jgi:hypothetical protein
VFRLSYCREPPVAGKVAVAFLVVPDHDVVERKAVEDGGDVYVAAGDEAGGDVHARDLLLP